MSPGSKVTNNEKNRVNMFHTCFFADKLSKQEKRMARLCINMFQDTCIIMYGGTLENFI